MRPARLRRQDGFTMVELLVALSIFMLIVVGILQIFEPSNAANLSSQRKLSVQQNGRVAMDVVVRQIRMAGYYPENFDANPLNDITTPASIQWLLTRPCPWPGTSTAPARATPSSSASTGGCGWSR